MNRIENMAWTVVMAGLLLTSTPGESTGTAGGRSRQGRRSVWRHLCSLP